MRRINGDLKFADRDFKVALFVACSEWFVIPAKVGIRMLISWIPVCTGMTEKEITP